MQDITNPRQIVLISCRGSIKSSFTPDMEIKEDLIPINNHMPISDNHYALSFQKESYSDIVLYILPNCDLRCQANLLRTRPDATPISRPKHLRLSRCQGPAPSAHASIRPPVRRPALRAPHVFGWASGRTP